jgi:putative exporter of polyketide antibiotics
MRYIDHHDPNPLGPNFQHIGGVLFGPIRSTNLNLLYFAQLSRKYDKSGMFEMHMSLVVGKKLSMHR